MPISITKISVTLAIFLSMPFFALATTPPPLDPDLEKEVSQIFYGCKEYSRTGELYATAIPVNKEVKAGDIVNFTGEIINSNKFPITSLSVFVKITTKNADGSINIIDQFFAKEGIDVAGARDKLASTPISFEWKSPQSLISGEYSVLTYTFVGDHLKMNGFNFSDDYATNPNTFNVISSNEIPSPYFSKLEIRVNENTVVGDSGTSYTDPSIPTIISAPIVNESDIPFEAKVKWTAYKGFVQNEKTLIETKTDTVKLPAKGKLMVTYFPNVEFDSDTLVIGELELNGVKSFINISINKQGVRVGRISLAGLTNIDSNYIQPSIFACFNAKDSANDENLSFSVEVLDDIGNLIFSDSENILSNDGVVSYSKPISNIPKHKNKLFLTAQVKSGGDILDSVSLKYSCNGVVCGNSVAKPNEVEEVSDSKVLFVVIVTLLTLMIVMMYFINHKRSMDHIYKKEDDKDDGVSK